MTAKKFLLYTFLQWVLFIFLKIWFFEKQIFEDPGLQELAFWLATAVIAAACVRRMGVLTYFESIIAIILWTGGGLFLDLVVTSAFVGLGMFYTQAYWIGFLVMDLIIFTTHKKRHIHERHKAHGHH